MEVAVATPSPMDSSFDSNCSSPYMTAPSSPQRFGNFYFSAPASPSRVSAFYPEQAEVFAMADRPHSSSPSSLPFNWEERPGVPKGKSGSQPHTEAGNEDFEFDFSGQLDRISLTAEELFEDGKIRPLKLPPRLQSFDSLSSPGSKSPSPRSKLAQGKRIFQEALSPRHRRNHFDPFAAAMEETRKKEWTADHKPNPSLDLDQKRSRGRASSFSSSSGFVRRKGSRSLSPLRVSDILISSENGDNSSATNPSVPSAASNSKASFPPPPSPSPSSFFSSLSFPKGYRKWRLKDFLLFRSASEGRADIKDPLRNYAVRSKRVAEEDAKNLSCRSTDSSGSVSRRRVTVSPHELHYNLNRAVSEELKKKTSLPYKHGLLGCMRFNSGMRELARGIGSFTTG